MEEALNTVIHVINFVTIFEDQTNNIGGDMEEALNTVIHVINFVTSN